MSARGGGRKAGKGEGKGKAGSGKGKPNAGKAKTKAGKGKPNGGKGKTKAGKGKTEAGKGKGKAGSRKTKAVKGKQKAAADRRSAGRARRGNRDSSARSGRGTATSRNGDLAVARPPSRVGVIVRHGRGAVVEPLFERAPARTIESPRRNEGRYRDGDIVLLAPEQRSGRVRIERVIGRPDRPADVIEALLIDRGLELEFPEAVEREAAAAASSADRGGREDLRSLVTFTIDPVTARDFDDAISAERLGDGRTRVWVHIADVAAHVRPGGALDREAQERGTSVYVPGRVVPMLPHVLSSGACSLVPDEDRLAVTVEMTFDRSDVVDSRVMRSIIRSDMRLDYDEVDRILRGEVAAREPWAKPLDAARQVALDLAESRARAHAVTIDRPEREFTFDVDGEVNGWQAVEQTESHRLIEMLMVAANAEVARRLVEAGVPALHRVHERPEAESVNELLDKLASLDVPTPPAPERMTPSQAVEVVAKASVLVDHWTRAEQRGRLGITALVLRSLQQARYDADPLGHSGLGLANYCHFTSPIRRYPDVICHRAILAALGLGEPAPPAGLLDQLAVATSAREREAMQVERDADDIVACFLLARELDSGGVDGSFDGEVTGLIDAGLFVGFGGAFEGFLPVRRLGGGWWEANPEGTMLTDDRGGSAIRIGDAIRIRVGRVDVARGRCDLYPAGE